LEKGQHLNEALELVLLEEQVLRFDPSSSAPRTQPGMISIQQGETMQASVAVQVHPNALHPICEENLRDLVMKYGCK
jgi:hypothetical protein